MPVEVELKYRANGPGPLAVLASAERLGDAWLGPPRAFDEVDRYLDTPDGRLARARWACRLRTRGGELRVSLKGPAEGTWSGSLHRRPELEGPATDNLDPAAWPPSEARVHLDDLRSGEPLQERFTLRQHRTERSVAVGGAALGTLTLDVVAVESRGRDVGLLHAVELELHPAAGAEDEALLAALGAALEAIDGLQAESRTKLEHALVMIGSA